MVSEMNSKALRIHFCVLICGCFVVSSLAATVADPTKSSTIYDFTVKDTYGNDVPLSKFKGNIIVVVNIASKCTLAKNQYLKLMELRSKYHSKGLRIIAFPSNQFISQMPEADGDEVMKHLKENNVEFDLVMAKGYVNGESTHPLYAFLKEKQNNGILGSFIKWNFTKFLIDRNGMPVDRYAPVTDPTDIAKHIDKLLA